MTHPPLLRFTVQNCVFDLVFVEGGTFRMGMERDDPDSWGDEQPVHDAQVPGFYLGRLPVTQDLWTAVMGDAPAFFNGARRPVEQVSWEDAQKFMDKLKEITRGEPFRLPSEAEWEFAARGGIYNTGCKYAGTNRVKETAWFAQNSHGETKPAGRKFPNELGLYDMSGNVWEWCGDQWHGNYEGAPGDGSAWVDREEGSYRVYRGGSWDRASRRCRAADRGRWLPVLRVFYLGFRLALSLQ